ncbi:hypothetical protein HPB48_006069 [Haemaphysalis longicornis]|uniref:Uncharacterized protein n=1 Tax=Haemaphysalis longicornis TaxID=44386 RepID=A0A9J6FM91_HAELO|nr:hypothetical protein HPB48_006069 [Haemaphysalis longicornis]
MPTAWSTSRCTTELVTSTTPTSRQIRNPCPAPADKDLVAPPPPSTRAEGAPRRRDVRVQLGGEKTRAQLLPGLGRLHEAQEAHQRLSPLLPRIYSEVEARHEPRPDRLGRYPREPPVPLGRIGRRRTTNLGEATGQALLRQAVQGVLHLRPDLLRGEQDRHALAHGAGGHRGARDSSAAATGIAKDNAGLRTWEVNFAYFEKDEKKNALVKLRLCPKCSFKLNYRFQRKELTKTKAKRSSTESKLDVASESKKARLEKSGGRLTRIKTLDRDGEKDEKGTEESVWSKPAAAEDEKSQEEEFDSYLADMFL